MSNKVSNPVSAERLAEYNRKKEEYNKKLEKQEQKIRDKKDKALKEANAKSEATALGESLAKGITAYSASDFKNKAIDALEAKVKELEEDGIEGNELTKEQVKLAKKYIESKEFKKARENELKDYAFSHLYKEMSEVKDQTSGRGVQNAVRKEYDEQMKANKEEFNKIKKQYKKGEISKDAYEAEKAAYELEKDRLEMLKDNAGGTRAFKSFFGKKKKEANFVSDAVAQRNKTEKVQSKLTSSDEQVRTEAHMDRFSPELQAKINQSGFTTEELIELYDNNGTWADGTVNYSYNKGNNGQIGERKGLLTSLNANKNGYEFTENDVKEIGRALGYNVEKKVSFGQTAGDAGKATAIGAPFVLSAEATATAAAGTAVSTTASKVILPVGAVIGLTLGTAYSVDKQIKRVEPKAIPEDVYKGVKTYDEYVAKLKDNTTPEGFKLGSEIAKFYDFGADGFNIEQLERDMHHSAGTVEADKTPLNYNEARGLLIKLHSGEIKPTKPEKPVVKPEKTEEYIGIVSENKTAVVEKPGCEYQIKSGDHPYAIAMGLYGLEGNDPAAMKVARYIKKMAKEVSNGQAIFWKVGTVVRFPETIEGIKDKYGNDITVKCNNKDKVIAGIVDASYQGGSTGKSNDLGKETIKWQEYSLHKYYKNENNELVQGERIGNSSVIKSTVETARDNYKKENTNDNHKVIVR